MMCVSIGLANCVDNSWMGLASTTSKVLSAVILACILFPQTTCNAATEVGASQLRQKQPPKVLMMTAEHPFEMSDEDFWTNPDKNLSTLAGTRVRSRRPGLLTDSPKTIPIKQREQWPYLVLQTGDTHELYKVPFSEHAVVTAYSPSEGILYAARAIPKMGPAVDSGPLPSPGFTSNFENVDARAVLGIPWRNGRYVLTTVIRDQTSNRVTVELVSSLSQYADQEVQKYLAAQEKQHPPRPVSPPPSDARVFYQKTGRSATPPIDPGVVLSVDRVIEALPGARAELRGSFLLPVKASDVIPRSAVKGDEPSITAVVPISLLILGSEDAIPETLPLVVPSYMPTTERDGVTFATGQFTINLAQMGSFMLRPQTYFIHAFAGETMTPAAVMAVVPRQSR